MDFLAQAAAALGKAYPALTDTLLLVVMTVIAKQIATFSSNHIAHVQESLDRIERVMSAMNENVIRLLERTDHRK